jgi:GH15 family glucan-1,4-alpha-glucosidase
VPYQPIQNYGVIGDLHTVALVGTNGSIDWWCYPHFDSPAVFGAILDDKKGGRFQIAPVEPCEWKQLYFPDTNVLVTRFLSSAGVGEVTDFMPIRDRNAKEFDHKIVRRVEVVRGTVRMAVVCCPGFDYARARHEVEIVPGGAVFTSGSTRFGLATSAPITIEHQEGAMGPAVLATLDLQPGHSVWFEMYALDPEEQLSRTSQEVLEASLHNTIHYWRRWLASGVYTGRWRETVNRSALALKLLTFQPTGAIVAAPTTSLPEHVGGVRNWDYRYTWIRDASFTLYGLVRVGFTEEAQHFMEWLGARLNEPTPEGMQIVYSIEGKKDLTEIELPHLEGYRGSRPVRIGNGAWDQRQLDIYGELMDAVYLSNKYGSPIGYDLWLKLRPLVDWVCDNWRLPDEGIWEVRGGQREFVYSKVMCWVAIDRGLRLADKRSFPAPRNRWITVRDEIYEDVMHRGWSKKLQSFVQAYETEVLDASSLIMPLVFFMSPTDPRMMATLDAIMKELVSDSLVYRYKVEEAEDGLPGEEGTFSICTFWLVEALTRAGRVDEARLVFEKMLTYANHLGLYSEEIGVTGEALGNFPQGFTHLALISAAYNLNQALDRRHRGSPVMGKEHPG